MTPLNSPEKPEEFRDLDHAKEAYIARLTGGYSPAALTLSCMDWLIHLRAAPGKQLELFQLALQHMQALMQHMGHIALGQEVSSVAEPMPDDPRFHAAEWQSEPFRWWQQAFLLTEQWWNAATHGIPGTTPHHEDVVAFCTRQILDIFSPTNYLMTNPQVLQRTLQTQGQNLWQGMLNLMDDMQKVSAHKIALPQQFKVGVNIARTPGKVVFRNRLIELIQYNPTTDKVHAEPILIVPAWIMKYYILDLSEHNSMIRYLVGQGFTVFCISWHNVTEEDREISLEDYRRDGVMAALDAINSIRPHTQVHATGYCLGGTLLSIAATAMAGRGEPRLASLSLLAAQTDFSEPGELQLFIDDSEIYFIESMMWAQGYLAAQQMAGSFTMLQSNNLVWSRVIQEYLLGERTTMTDMMAWNLDATRMPYRMHSEYLRQLFLHNDLASNRYRADGHLLALRDIRIPMFVVGTETDHIAPWHSVYKIHHLTDTDITFVLTQGGHNAGIVSEPGHPHRHYRLHLSRAGDLRCGPDEWLASMPVQEGSWWVAWSAWLEQQCSPEYIKAPAPGLPGASQDALEPAPGTYVFQ